MEVKCQSSITKHKKILLFDDVLTTDATGNSFVASLKNSGVEWMGILTLATTRKKKR